MHKKGDRQLTVSFTLKTEDILLCQISDNGIGREHATLLKRKSVKTHQSMGIKIIRERIALMKKQNDVFDLSIVDRKDEEGNAAGTTVVVRIPIGRAEDNYTDKVYNLKNEQAIRGLKKEEIEDF
jgi:hypothetical protein